MEKEVMEKYVKAGNILFETQEYAKKILQPGAELFECAEKIEEFIVKKGAKPAFPVNLSLNENAAHQTPDWNEKTTLKESDVLKVDIGVHIDGYIADGAFTINHSGEHKQLIEAAELALKNAFALLDKDPSFSEIGTVIEKTISEKGFKVVRNLTGHGLARYLQHAPPSIPNIVNNIEKKFEPGKAYAIEPFASTASGYVRESGKANIFMLEEPRPVRNTHARKIMKFVEENYKTLPFAERWLFRELKMNEFELKVGLRQLLREKCIKAYPILHDMPNSFVAQAENSFIKLEGEIIPLVVPSAGKTKSK